jgi:hypothetical protein
VHVPHEWLDRFAAATGPHLHAFDGRQLSVVVWTLSARSYAPSAGYVSALLHATAPHLATLSDAQLLDTVWHLNSLGARPRQEWVLALVAACRARAFEPRVEGLMEQAVAQLIARMTGPKLRGATTPVEEPEREGQREQEQEEEPQLAAASPTAAARR